MEKRKCGDCNAPITACMGFVQAGDFNLAVEERIPTTDIRERYWKCVELHSDHALRS